MPPYVHAPSIHLDTPIHLNTPICSASFNRVFICYIIKCFPALKAVMGGVRLKWCPYTPHMFIHPHTSRHSPYIGTPHVFRVLIGYLFCYIIKYFSILEAVIGVVRLRGCPYGPYVNTPLYIWITTICSETFNRVFILLFHKMFSYCRGSHRGLSDLWCVHMPPSSYAPICFKSPICLDTPICSDAPKCKGHPNIWGCPNL